MHYRTLFADYRRLCVEAQHCWIAGLSVRPYDHSDAQHANAGYRPELVLVRFRDIAPLPTLSATDSDLTEYNLSQRRRPVRVLNVLHAFLSIYHAAAVQVVI